MDGLRARFVALARLFDRRRRRTRARKKVDLERAAREMERRDPSGGSIWRSGKGGSHPG
jgi:hypothetical protein